jgi:hypothetical protein
MQAFSSGWLSQEDWVEYSNYAILLIDGFSGCSFQCFGNVDWPVEFTQTQFRD